MGARSTVSKPLPGGMTFDQCVTRFEGDDQIDDPEGFCAWLEEEGKEALDDPNADELLSDLIVEFVSPVDEPAQDSQWLIMKNATDPEGRSHRWKSETTLYLAKDVEGVDFDTERRIAFAPVLIPGEADKQGDVVPAPEIEKAAHNYLANHRKVDSDHDLFDGKGVPVESWTLKQATTFELPDGTESREFPVGTWVMGVKFDDGTWERVKEGELTGFSIYGGAKPIDVDVIREAVGLEKSVESNDHGMTESPTADLRERVAQVKQDADDWSSFLDIVDAYIEDHGGEIDEITIAEVAQWWEDFEPEEDEEDAEDGDDGEGDDESPDEQEQSKSMSDEDNPEDDESQTPDADGGDPGDEQPDGTETEAGDGTEGGDADGGGDDGGTDLPDDTPEWAKSLSKDIRGSVDEVRSDVDDLADRVDDLEKQVDEGEFANERMSEDEDEERMKTLKSLGLVDDDDDEDTVEAKRKALREQVSKSVEDDGIEIDYSGVADGDVAGEDGSDDRDTVSKSRNKRMVPLGGDN